MLLGQRNQLDVTLRTEKSTLTNKNKNWHKQLKKQTPYVILCLSLSNKPQPPPSIGLACVAGGSSVGVLFWRRTREKNPSRFAALFAWQLPPQRNPARLVGYYRIFPWETPWERGCLVSWGFNSNFPFPSYWSRPRDQVLWLWKVFHRRKTLEYLKKKKAFDSRVNETQSLLDYKQSLFFLVSRAKRSRYENDHARD